MYVQLIICPNLSLQNRGVYMFRIDDHTVVDATMSGGPARYINHSCDPNCQAEVVELDKDSKIIIITNRRISKGEEVCSTFYLLKGLHALSGAVTLSVVFVPLLESLL